MLFSSGEFIFLFLPISLIGYQLCSKLGRTAILSWFALISLFFYGYWNPTYLILLGCSILLNFTCSRLISAASSEAAKTRLLAASITVNLLLLMWFKYLFPLLDFFNRHGLIHHGFGDVMLPLGISFFTFTQIAYLIDLRQGVAGQQSLLAYTVFVTFFPHLIAGPIIHPREMMPQFEAKRLGSLRADDVALGLSWFILGLAKKVLLADRVSTAADILFAHQTSFGPAKTWIGVACYAMQLYFDFSGYSDMALGLARMFSIEFPMNFNSPYKASNIIDFWQNWHMTLSRYIAEYLYTPILRAVNGRRMDAGKKVSKKAQATFGGFTQMVAFPVLTSMFIAGIWHGAGLQYLIFGVLHGVYLVTNHAWRIFTPKGHALHGKLPMPLSVAITFVCVLLSLVFFRSADVHQAFYLLGTMAGRHGVTGPAMGFPFKSTSTLVICALCAWGMPNTQEILGQLAPDGVRWRSLLSRLAWKPNAAWSIGLMLLFCLAIAELDSTASFLYFQF